MEMKAGWGRFMGEQTKDEQSYRDWPAQPLVPMPHDNSHRLSDNVIGYL